MKNLTPLKAIRLFCLSCREDYKSVLHCPSKDCPLWVYRRGHNPKRKGITGKKRDIKGLIVKTKTRYKTITIRGEILGMKNEKEE